MVWLNNSKVTIRAPYSTTITGGKATLSATSISGLPTFEINEVGRSIPTTRTTVNATQKINVTSAGPVLSTTVMAADAEINFHIDVAGTATTEDKIHLARTSQML